jgi:hypothetical protein
VAFRFVAPVHLNVGDPKGTLICSRPYCGVRLSPSAEARAWRHQTDLEELVSEVTQVR